MSNEVATDNPSSQEDLIVGYYAICVIDILGQKERLAEWPQDMELSQEYIDAIKATCGRVDALQKAFESYFSAIEGRDCSWLNSHPEHVRRHHARYTDCDLRIQQFSDTFVFFAPMANSHGDASMVPLLRMLGASAMVMLWGMVKKYPIRGGITIGPGMVLPNGSIYGPALAEAHALESRIAEYPRVVVSDNVLHVLESEDGFSKDPGIEKSMKALAFDCRSMIVHDPDGTPMVDFLGQIPLPHSEEDAKKWEQVEKAAFEFVRASLAAYEATGDQKLAGRYRRLLSYMESSKL